ncbi:Copper chaperone [Handroanthus impetiginosus]|uniref:Copper chaperone n=1 Tax=Handroanthus impetiginosus TaxID=429701 RepID=A0A2G9HDC0_9LAMI|nr:Copper chaperone [Handroanthus impetiginosus]
MHCDACERGIAKAISDMKGFFISFFSCSFLPSFNGVEKFMTDMKNHKVVITGRIDAQKVLKKLKKKTGKRVELLVVDEDCEKEEKEESKEQVMDDSWLVRYYEDGEIHMMFSDENANSCFIM